MANRSFVRDQFGRFAKTVGASAAKAATKAAREAADDAKRVAKAKLEEAITDAHSSLVDARRAATAVEKTKRDVETDSEAVDFEVRRKKARDAVRKAQLKYTALREAQKVAR